MDLMVKLEQIYNINQTSDAQTQSQAPSSKRKSESTNSPANTKKIKTESTESPEKDPEIENTSLNGSFQKTEAPKKETAKDKALSKAAKGTKSIASFFTKK